MATIRAQLHKVHTSALCYIPPLEQQEGIQHLRVAHDKQIHRWPPHVNLLYPFLPEEEFEAAAAHLAAMLQGVPPFGVTFERMRQFKHGKKRFTAWLDPTACEEGQWQALQARCLEAFPHCTDQTARGAFVPHLTIGQFGDEDLFAAREQPRTTQPRMPVGTRSFT